MPSTAVGSKSSLQKQKAGAGDKGKQAINALPWTPVVHGQVSSLPIVFTRDAEFFFVAASSSVKIYSRITGQLVSTLSSAASTSSRTTWSGRQVTESHEAAITGLVINPANSLQLLTCSLDGTIKVWDYLDAVLLRTIDLSFPISHMVAHHTIKGSVYVALKKPKSVKSSDGSSVNPFQFNGRCNSIIQLVSLTTSASKGVGATKAQNVTRVGKARQTTAISLSADGKHLVLIGKRKIHIARSDALQEGFSKVISDQELTCLAFHPENNTFATGDAIGQIRLWYFLDNEQKIQRNVKGVQVAPSVLMHWHAHAVSALAFTPNGANLLSGGEESVMVLWQLANQNREYVPRLGGATISSITVLQGNQGREEEYVASLSDCSIAFIGAINLKANRTISQVLIDSSRQLLGDDYLSPVKSFPLAVQPGSNHLVMSAGHPSSLQFLDVDTDRLVSQMEVVPSNRISRPDEIPLAPSRVERVCFSASGNWMATADSRARGELSLKLWRWDAKDKKYTLNSRVENPHNQGTITSMAFSPRPLSAASTSSSVSSTPLLLTTGTDNKARTWRKITQVVKGSKREEFWIARSAFDYRNLPIIDASWEPNGSLLAVCHDGFVTVWEPLSNSLQQVIPIAGMGKGVVFTGKGGRYVAAVSDRCLVVWDIVFGQVAWEKEVASDQIIVSGEESFSIMFGQRNSTKVTTFSPKSSSPLGHHQLPLALRKVCGFVSQEVPIPSPTPCFYALTHQYDVVRAGVSHSDEMALQGRSPTSLRGVSVKRRTLYDELIGPRDGEKQQGSLESVQSISNSKQRSNLVAGGLFEVASHLLPPMSVLYEPIIEQMLLPRRKADETASRSKSGAIAEDEEDLVDEDDVEEDMKELSVTASNGAIKGINRLRQLSEMDWSEMTALFESQARVSPKLTTNGKASGGMANGKTTNGTKKDTSVNNKRSPRKSSMASPVKAAHGTVNGNGNHVSVSNKDSDTPVQGSGRKRKIVE